MSAPQRIGPRDYIRPATYSTGELSQRLGRAPDWFYKNKERLYAHGMPRPLPMPGHPRWNRARVEAWLAGWLGESPTAANDPAPAAVPADEDRNVKDWQEHLARRYRGG